ncbi:ATP-dependent helicase [Herbiconiux sp. SYSU D00978]|uniref:ATP-dependent helicase n=1 Tax=Herbiconiux sp. SYSU D00978 TaxID=2812562 RepID=UPI001A969420|nr:ATP-dependent DNA helicase [Herbiconiux sp. SYSU D00978]
MTDLLLPPTATIGAREIAEKLGQPPPTEQQRAVIESELAPALVVAGAGSGKTETMAARVLWLLANGLVRPSQILGLTFTRKAASELSTRIRKRMLQLEQAGLMPGEPDPFEVPTVATYNSFANSVYGEHAVLLGRESDGVVLSEASAWQLARSIVLRSDDPRLPGLGKSIDQVTAAVLSLSSSLSEHVADAAAVRSFAEDFARVAERPNGGKGAYADVDDTVARVAALPVLLDLAERFAQAKQERSFVEYSDQVALALEVAEASPRVAEELRDRYRVVLLDEYQDTSVVQTRLLSRLFAGTPVMAVGDPHQSIYGWRGASASNLDDFARTFGAERTFALSTSWRNGHRILEAANVLVAPLTATTSVPVEQLHPSPVATDLPVDSLFPETVEDEADATARWLKAGLDPHRGAAEQPSAAILFRTRKTMRFFIDALRRHDVPFHVLGLGALLEEPEVADLVCALTVLDDPTAGSQLVRLLGGSRWRLGVRDLDGLKRIAHWLRERDYAYRPLEDGVKDALRGSFDDAEDSSIVDAVDFVATAPADHGQLENLSPAGVERVREAGRLFASLRALPSLDLVDLVTAVQQALLLDVEVLANDARVQGPAPAEALFDALESYLSVADVATLGGFLSWLDEAAKRDDIAPRAEEPEAGTVQLLTIHGSKGLEWDFVAVPRLVEDELPGKPREGFVGWLSFGALPYAFRGDAADLPALAWETAETRKDVVDAIKRFKAAVAERSVLEERRLAYVAVTRARHRLLVTGSFWATQTRARCASRFLVELADAGVVAPLPEASEHEENPLAGETLTFLWPRDPLGTRRPAVEAAAELVRRAEPGHAGAWQRSLDLLLAERRRRLEGSEGVTLPSRVPASRFKDYVADPARVARELRRPMPERPYRATRLGTLFHSWVEARSGVAGSGDLLDAAPAELDVDLATDDAGLDALKAIFERSEWADLAPVDVEQEIQLVLDGQVVVCKIDAVYLRDGRYQIVDWKTGKAPRSAEELEERQLQLALYRLAYARRHGIDPDLIDAVFYYVADDRVIRPERVFDEDELVELWRAAVGG